MTPQVILGFVVFGEGMTADPGKIKSIVKWPEPTNILRFVVSMGWPISTGGLFGDLVPL